MPLKVNKCCCMNLRTGSLVIALICTVINVLSFLPMCVLLDAAVKTPPSERDDKYFMFAVIIVVVCITAGLLNLVANILLILGIKKRNHRMFLPWLILGVLGLGSYALRTLIMFILYIIVEPLNAVAVAIVGGLVVAFSFWLWLVVYSLYQETKEASQRSSHMNLQSPSVENGQFDRVPPFEAMEKDPTY